MSEAVFDFAAINRRMNRKPEPVAVVDVVSTPNVTFGGCKYAPNLAKKLYTVPIMEPPPQSLADCGLSSRLARRDRNRLHRLGLWKISLAAPS